LDETEQFRRSQAIERNLASVLFKPTPYQGEAPMYNSINISSIFVLDQDKALDFYVNKLGLEVSSDMDLGFMRWLTVRVPGQPGRDVLLELPAPPALDGRWRGQVREPSPKAPPVSHWDSLQMTAGKPTKL